MARRADILPRLPIVFGLGEVEAAAAIGVSASLFRDLVKKGLMPRPRCISGRRVYDVKEIEASFRTLPHDGELTSNPWDEQAA